MNKEAIFAAVAALALTLPGGASAAPVEFTTVSNTFGSDPQVLSFDETAWADNATIFSTIPGGTPAAGLASIVDADLSTLGNLNDSLVELFFTDNVLVNGVGNDLAIFQSTNNNSLRVEDGAGGSIATTEGVRFVQEDGTTPGTFVYNIGVTFFDLSDLGFADGAEITSGLFLKRGGIFSNVYDVAALNSRVVVAPPPDPGVIPLPAAGWLLIGGLAGLIGLGRRRQA